MKIAEKFNVVLLILLGVVSIAQGQTNEKDLNGEWVSLFNGENLDGWKVGENANTFSVVDGKIKAAGDVAHLFYDGEVANHQFKNFEFKASVMTTPNSNSGIYIHTQYQESDWPMYGYEAQVNNSHTDWRRTGSLYAIADVKENYVEDNEWYTEYVEVEGNRIIIKINDIVLVDYTEPENPLRDEGSKYRILSRGTFALQGHDPESVVYYKDIMVRLLPD
ncbi:3-keto-disaccharide hydrolase [Eudoraea sp.]|uniref:3-keto-disaccharide hydrolase n=1 Tax=Eudoraea sp. TaxID=1979955 RepID=UPI003C75AC8A